MRPATPDTFAVTLVNNVICVPYELYDRYLLVMVSKSGR